MRSYIIRGHGELLNTKFKLGPEQYVVFAQQCGDPALFGTTLHPAMKRILRSPTLLERYIRGNYNKSKFPPAFKNPIILGPGNSVRNMSINMQNNRPWVHETFGIFNAQMNNGKRSLYSTRNRWYLRGRGKKDIKLSSRTGIGDRKGVFYVDSCRVRENYSPKNNVSERIFTGLPSGLPRTRSNIQTHVYETRRTQRFKAKRKRPQSDITLRKKANQPPTKRRKTGDSPVREPPRKKRITKFYIHKIFQSFVNRVF